MSYFKANKVADTGYGKGGSGLFCTLTKLILVVVTMVLYFAMEAVELEKGGSKCGWDTCLWPLRVVAVLGGGRVTGKIKKGKKWMEMNSNR